MDISVKKYLNGKIMNDLTMDIDKHLVFGDKYIGQLQTYIYNCPLKLENGYINFPIRYPGSTVGGVNVDENMVIREIIVDSKIYNDSISECFEKYIGCRLLIVE